MSVMRILTTCLLAALCAIPFTASSQVYLEPVAGYQLDANNGHNKNIQSALNIAFRKNRIYEFLFKIQQSWPVSAHQFKDSSYTLNPTLPLNEPAIKKIKRSSFSIALGNRFTILNRKKKDRLYVDFTTGLNFQHISVSYQYDKTNYTILNPDRDAREWGPFVGFGIGYMRQVANHRFFTEISIASSPTATLNYPSSYRLAAPFSLNIGYSFQISKKHGK